MIRLLLLVGLSLFGIDANAQADNATNREPINVIRFFYEGLNSNSKSNELIDIFTGVSDLAPDLRTTDSTRYSGLSDVGVIWEFLRNNRNIFLFEGINPNEIINKAQISYVFSGFTNPETLFDGRFSVQISLPLAKGGKCGVYKQINFPMLKVQRNESTVYVIDVALMRVNGALLDFSSEFDRTKDLWSMLGLTKKE